MACSSARFGTWGKTSETSSRIEAMSTEAVTTSGIEGEILDRASVQSSLRKQLELVAKAPSHQRKSLNPKGVARVLQPLLGFATDERRVRPAERGIPEYTNGAGAGSPSTEFIYSDAIPGAGLLASVSNGSITYFQSDHLDWRVATNASGQVTGSQGHFPFGESWYSSDGNEFAFTSYQRDSESGLDYAMARYYDSMAGRMCSADPVGGDPNDPQTWNRYAYVRNDPINITDASGKSWWSWLVDAVVGALAVILPEAYPALFSFMGQTTVGTATLDYTVTGGYVASASAPIEVVTEMASGTLTATVTLTNVSTIDLGLLGGTAAKASLDSRNMDRFYKAQIKAEQDLKNGNCQQFLQQHGINPSDLTNSVQNEAPYNGLKSNISIFNAQAYDPNDPFNMQQGEVATNYFKQTSIARSFQDATQQAISQSPGHDVYFRPGGRFGSGGITPGNIIHEGLHNLTGLGDARLANKLGLPKGSGSADINPALQAHHCFGS